MKTTRDMLIESLQELYSRQGVSLVKLKRHIAEKYEITLSPIRITLIKKFVKAWITTGQVVNVTGRGLVGKFKLKKKNFVPIDSTVTQNTTRSSGLSREPNHSSTPISVNAPPAVPLAPGPSKRRLFTNIVHATDTDTPTTSIERARQHNSDEWFVSINAATQTRNSELDASEILTPIPTTLPQAPAPAPSVHPMLTRSSRKRK
ncbi:uncharacterized protein LOC119684306 [Teleopsis dalmanni]|uniref:uncharacterized protein LOC119684306 n=1 Tax=Teleopsis dalmanni TaxID=139649 RepID=UPI0018CEB18D|nr:uncharacterized protein LOC119684306 [Teleopsis dalmanni]